MRTFKNVLITGGCGFIGSHLVKLFTSTTDINVTVLDSLTYAGDKNNLKDVEVEIIEIDIRNEELLKKFFENKRFDAIIHLAAESHVDNSISSPKEFLTTNVFGTMNLLEHARVQHSYNPDFIFYHVSTDEVYGSLDLTGDDAFNETTAYDPRSPYSASKAASDHFVKAYYHTYGLPIVISNCSNNYGTHQHREKLIPVVIESLVNNKSIPVYGSGINKRDWLHVTDHALAIITILQKGTIGETYCVGGGNVISNLDLIKNICKIYDSVNNSKGSENLISFVEDRKGHDLRYSIDFTKMKTELGWSPSLSFQTGLKETVKWYTDKLKTKIKINDAV